MNVLQLTTGRRSFFERQVTGLEAEGVECTVLEVPGDYDPASPRTLSDYAEYFPQVRRRVGDSYDVIHANYGLVAPFALAQTSLPVVITFWGTELMGDRAWLKTLSRWSARLADRVVLPSQALAGYLPCRYSYIPFPVDTDTFRPIPREQARERVGWDSDDTVVLFPYDTSRPEKDFPRARRIVEAADADAELRAVSGEPHGEIPYYLNASDAVLVTSKRESGPMVVREAAACNVPVVSTDVGFARETLADVDQSAVRDADDDLTSALETVLSGSGRSDGRSKLGDLEPKQTARRLKRLYESVTDARGERR